MGSLIEELRRREAAVRAEAERLRTRIEELSEDLARAEEQASRLVIAREEVARALEEPAVAEPPAGQNGRPAVKPPRWACQAMNWAPGPAPMPVTPAAMLSTIQIADHSRIRRDRIGASGGGSLKALPSRPMIRNAAAINPEIAAEAPTTGAIACQLSARCSTAPARAANRPTAVDRATAAGARD